MQLSDWLNTPLRWVYCFLSIASPSPCPTIASRVFLSPPIIDSSLHDTHATIPLPTNNPPYVFIDVPMPATHCLLPFGTIIPTCSVFSQCILKSYIPRLMAIALALII
mmetsp:Transcript_105967/g.182741  ORF Transcript_105967/g.182741 Transcript_105967/m.182741 type:complete len:108 (-) Transcript_105967:892-1215(-)